MAFLAYLIAPESLLFCTMMMSKFACLWRRMYLPGRAGFSGVSQSRKSSNVQIIII